MDEGEIFSIRRRPLDGSRPEETVYKSDGNYSFGTVVDWSPDGKYLSVDLVSKETSVYSNWIVPSDGSGKAFCPPASAPITAQQYDGRFSPDGRWLTYFSYESGRPEVYLIPFLSAGAKYQATTTGGWLGEFSGTDFHFLTMGNRPISGRMVTQPNFRLDDVHPLFQFDLPNFSGPNMDVSRDGQRVVVLTADRTKTSSITLLTNWMASLKK